MDKIKTYDELRSELARHAEDEYREFIMKGIPSERPFIGVRIPIIRRLVGLVPRDLYGQFLKVEPVAFEEVVARGMMICKMPYPEMATWFDSQIGLIDDWCTCDTFCSAVCRKISRHRDEFFELKVEGLLSDPREFAIRSGLVLLKCGYVTADYLAVIFDKAEELAPREEYYVKMALAWLLSECFIKFPEETLDYMKASHLPAWTFNKTISKICDSLRVDEDTKTTVRKMRKLPAA